MHIAHGTMHYDVVPIVHDIYVRECQLRSCITDFKGACPQAPALTQMPFNSIKHFPWAFPHTETTSTRQLKILIEVYHSHSTWDPLRHHLSIISLVKCSSSRVEGQV